MATPRVLRLDANGRPLEFPIYLLCARRLLESQVQAGESLWAHAIVDLPAPDDPTPFGTAPDDAARDRFTRQRADLTAWKSRDAAACIALSSLLPESEEAHFTQVHTASEFPTAIKARYATPTTVSLGRLFLPFLFPDLASFERSADLIAHLRSLDSSYRATCIEAQLALLPPPMAITIYFIATSLPDRLASVRDALLLKHPSELTIEVLESALKDVESNLRSVASASDRGGKRGGQGTGGGGGGGVGGGGGGGGVPTGGGESAGLGEASRAPAGDSALAAGGGDARARQPPFGLPAAAGGAAAWYLAQRQQQPLPLQQPQQVQRQQQVSGPGQRQPQRGVVHPSCTYQVLTGARRGQPCGRTHPPGQCFAQLTDTVCLAFGVGGPAPDWLPLVQMYGSALWGMSASQLLDLLGTPHAMYADVDSSASDSVYSNVVRLGASLAELPVASVGTCVDTSPGATSEDASLSFTLDSGALHCFFRDHTTLTPLPAPVSVALADPTSGSDTASYTTTLPCPAVPSRSLIGFHVPSFSRNLVGVRPLVSRHVGVWIEPSGETAVCVDGDTYSPLATFTAEPGSGLYTLHTGSGGQQQQQQRLLPPASVTSPSLVPASHRVAASSHVAVSGQDSSDFTFYHPPSHRFFDSRDIRFEESTPFYVRYPSRGLPVPPPPLFLTSAPPPAPPVQPPPPGPASSGVSQATPPPSVAPQVQPPSPQSSSQPSSVPAGADPRGEGPIGASSGGAGVGDEPVVAGDSCLPGAGVGLADFGGATSGGAGAPSSGPGEPSRVAVGSADSGGGAPGALEGGPGAAAAPNTTPPPHPYLTRHQARVRRAREEQLELEREERGLQRLEEQQQQQEQLQHPQLEPPQQQEAQLLEPLQQQEEQQQQQQPPPPPPVFGIRALGLPSRSPSSSPSPPISGPPLPPPDPSRDVFPRSQPPLSPPPSQTWASRHSPRARPSSPVLVTDLRTALFRSSPPRSSPSLLPSPPETAFTASLSTPVTDYYRTYRPVLSRVLASLVTNPRASVSSVSALTAAVSEFASTHRLDYATGLVAAPPTSPLAVGGESALRCDVLEDKQFELYFLAAASPHLCAMLLAPERDPDALDIPTPRTYAEAVSGPWASQWRAAMDAEMASYRSTGTYIDEVPPPLGANVVDGMWIYRVKRPPGSPLVFKARYVARGFSQREGVDFFQTFAPTPKMTTLQVLQRFELQHSTVQRTSIAVDHRLTGPFPDKSFESSGPYAELVGCLMYLMTCTRSDLAFPLSILARFVAPGRHRPVHWTAAVRVAKYLATTSGVGLVLGGQQPVVLTGHCDSSYADDAETHRSTQGYCFSLGSGAVSWRSTRSSSVSTSTAKAEIYAGAMAAQELRWLTFLLADLGERPSSAPTLFTDNKASILLCREPRLESRVKHINVRYFLLRELQRRGQARFEFVESEANTADIFTKALPPCDHQRCCVQLGLVDNVSSRV
ncbi:unnamed protein product [Closterium sp. NIES-54]